MIDLLITRGKNRAYVWSRSKLGDEWIRKNYTPHDIISGGVQIGVGFHPDAVEDLTKILDQEEEVTYEVK